MIFVQSHTHFHFFLGGKKPNTLLNLMHTLHKEWFRHQTAAPALSHSKTAVPWANWAVKEKWFRAEGNVYRFMYFHVPAVPNKEIM